MRAVPGWLSILVEALQYSLTGLLLTRIAWSVRVVGIVLFLLSVLASFISTIFTFTSLQSIFHVKGHLVSLLQTRCSYALASSITILVWVASALFIALLASILSETTTILLGEVQIPHMDNIITFAAFSSVFIIFIFAATLVRHNHHSKVFLVTLVISVVGLLFMTYQIVYSINLQYNTFTFNSSVLKYAFFTRFTLSAPVVFALVLPAFSFIPHNTSRHSKSSYTFATVLALSLVFLSYIALGFGEQLLLSMEQTNKESNTNHAVSPVHSSMSPFTIFVIYLSTISAIYRTFMFADETVRSVASCFPYSTLLTDIYTPYGFIYTAVLSTFFAISIIDVHSLSLWTSSFLICAYTLINWSTYNNQNTVCSKLRSLIGSFVCASLSLVVGWQYAVIPAILFTIIFACLDSKAADSIMTSAISTYTSTIHSLHQLEEAGQLQIYCPQILLLTGNPAARPALVDFANNITRGKSLLICGYVIPQSPTDRTYLMMQKVDKQMTEWLSKREVHAFGVTVAHQKKSDGAITLLQTAGIGQLRPNILMLGYKTDWDKVVKHNPDAIQSYYDVVLSGFEKNVGVAILRNSIAGFDVTYMMAQAGERETTLEDLERGRTTYSTPGTSRKASLADGIKNLTSTIRKHTAFVFTSESDKEAEQPHQNNKKQRFEVISKHSVVATPGEHLMVQLHRYRTPIQRAVIDVWWLRDDGGLTLLLPYLLSLKGSYLEGAHLRIFTQSDGSATQVGSYHQNMAAFLQKLHFDCSDLHVLSEFNDAPCKETCEQFDSLVDELLDHEKYKRGLITQELLKSYEHKTKLYLRTSELIRERSSQASLIAVTLPRPHRDITGSLYLSWLEVLSRELPPVLFIRGNGQKIIPHV